MRFLIELIGKLAARRLQQGSPARAFVGTFLGLLIGIGLAYTLWQTGGIDSIVGPAIAMSIGFMIAGALAGSALGPKAALDPLDRFGEERGTSALIKRGCPPFLMSPFFVRCDVWGNCLSRGTIGRIRAFLREPCAAF
jgi:hypothetical protein